MSSVSYSIGLSALEILVELYSWGYAPRWHSSGFQPLNVCYDRKLLYSSSMRLSSSRAVGPVDNSMQRQLHELNTKHRAVGPAEQFLTF